MMRYAFQKFSIGRIKLYMIAGIVGMLSFGVLVGKSFQFIAFYTASFN